MIKGQLGEGLVYFLATSDGQFVRIGCTGNPRQRFRALATEARQRFGTGIKVIGFLPGHFGTEAWIQAKFEGLRVHGDWYMLAPPIWKFIEAIGLLPPEFCNSNSMRGIIQGDYAITKAEDVGLPG